MREIVRKHEGRIVTCTIPDYKKLNDLGYPQWQAEELGRAKKAGAVGLKISKTLGLYLREGGFQKNEREPNQTGPLVKLDDARFFPLWKAAGELKMPVFMHVADPDAFFLPIDRYNERWEELQRHPDASFYGKDFPTKPQIHAARDRVIAAHPQTTFIGLHVATHPENLDHVSNWLNTFPNTMVEIGARLGELGRQPRRARQFFEQFQDRIMFGTDASPNGVQAPQQDLEPEMYRCYFRCLETEDEYFDYSPAGFPPQGFWKIYGIDLPDSILRKVYHDNAAKLMGWELV
jgi:predicted TIM-barrel fold metal-dependent hydrolase